MSSRASRTLYVGNLPGDIREREVEDLFFKYGPIIDIDLKIPPRPPGYAFVEFEDTRDAEDAIRGRDGYNFDGHRLRVELAHGGRGHSSSLSRHSSYSGGGGSRGGVSRRTDYRVLVTGLPSSASWQDLKDHMRRAGDVCFSEVFRDGGEKSVKAQGHTRPRPYPCRSKPAGWALSRRAGLLRDLQGSVGAPMRPPTPSRPAGLFLRSEGTTGIVDYTNYDDMKYAIRKLDDSEFRNAFSRAYIRVKEYDSSKSRSVSRSRSPSRSRSNGRSRSRSKSPKVKASRRSRSRSRSVSSGPRKGRSLSRIWDTEIRKKCGLSLLWNPDGYGILMIWRGDMKFFVPRFRSIGCDDAKWDLSSTMNLNQDQDPHYLLQNPIAVDPSTPGAAKFNVCLIKLLMLLENSMKRITGFPHPQNALGSRHRIAKSRLEMQLELGAELGAPQILPSTCNSLLK
ncbi:hypothetical protein Syun_007917 [Stephania yunnanensis]|uniref:RRM domain-containing protein n=1 Tax=Stephania yunnanensis TaxID=152371 RepID=A0AAP0Q2V5_9MAGN